MEPHAEQDYFIDYVCRLLEVAEEVLARMFK
jgi:hypothetical protein